MNKLIHRLYKLRHFSWLIAFFIGGIFYSITCHAQAMPTPSADTFSTIINGNNHLSFALFSNVDVLPINPNPVDIYRLIEDVAQDPIVVGTQLNLMQNNDYTVSELSQTEIDEFSEVYPYLYDVNGNTVSWDDVYHLHYMNGMFHGDVYIDSSGNILTSDQNNTKSMFQLGVGGYLLGVSDIANIYDDIALQLSAKNYSYPLDDDITPYSVYINIGYYWNTNQKYAGYIFIPSGFSDGNTVYKKETNQLGIYTNDLSNVIYKQYYPTNSSGFIVVNSGSYSVNNKTYSYYIHFNNLYGSDITSLSLTSYSDFISNPQRVNYVFDRLNYNQNVSVLSSDDIVSFKKIITLPSTKQLQFDDTYDYNYINEVEQALNNTTSSPNELFDNNQAISEQNYPLNIEVPENLPDKQTSDLPFPSNNPNPNPNPSPSPSLQYDPDIQPNIENAINSFQNLQIPFITGISDRYPFSIPWDIANFVRRFSSEPTPPAWNFDWNITVGNTTYTKHFEGDLSDFNSLAEIFRNLILISFIIALCKFSYDHHF